MARKARSHAVGPCENRRGVTGVQPHDAERGRFASMVGDDEAVGICQQRRVDRHKSSRIGQFRTGKNNGALLGRGRGSAMKPTPFLYLRELTHGVNLLTLYIILLLAFINFK